MASGPSRNQIWQVDHTLLDIVVLPPRGKPLRPWLTTFVDLYTRLIMGWAIALTHDAGSVLSALRSALLCDNDLGGYGGIPAVVECDGKELTAPVLQRPCDTLGIRIRQVEKYEGRGKGRIERWHGTVSSMLVTQLPGYTGGPRDKRGRLYGPIRDDASWRAALPDPLPTEGQAATALPITAFTRVFASWAHWFNTRHTHQGIAGRAPLHAWRADPTPIGQVAPEDLRDLLLTQEDATVTSHGIRFRNLHYRAVEIQGMAGEKVTIRYAPHDDRFLEVYDATGRHLGTAKPVDAHTPEGAEAYRQAWAAESRHLAARRRRANQRIRRRIEPLSQQHAAEPAPPGSNGEAAPAETRLIPSTAPQPRATRPRGSTSLLGLRETTVLPEFEPPADPGDD
jgi:putative transposase